jgi:two-component sensor histidine kinase
MLDRSLVSTCCFDFLSGGGEMGARIRAYDWNSSVLGPPQDWPQSLRVIIRLILNSRQPMLIWWGPELIQFYNDAYIPLMETERHPGALGGRGRDFCEHIWDFVGPQIDHVMAGNGSTGQEDRLVPTTRNGRRENAWWSYSFAPIDVEDGVGGVLVICNEVTSQHLAQEALTDQTRYLMRLFEQAPGFMAVLRGPDHVFELTNAAFKRLIGDHDFAGKPVREILPDIMDQAGWDLLDDAYRTGMAYVGSRAPFLTGGTFKEAFVDFVYQPIVEANGEISGIFVAGVDVTDHVHAEHHLQLVNAELEHRVKNNLAVVGAIASQTLRGHSTDAAFEAFQNRLVALGKAHDILTSASQPAASIRDVVENALAPHNPGTRRISISGPHIIAGSKQALSLWLAIHELATNAIKYGALSDDRGRIDISWRETPDGDTPIFHFVWREREGPPVVKPLKKGFGSELIEGGLAWDFGARVDVSYEPSGFICRLTAPMGNLGAPLPSPVPHSIQRSTFGELRRSLEPAV